MQSEQESNSAASGEAITSSAEAPSEVSSVTEISPEIIAMEGTLQPVYDTLEPLLGAEQAEGLTRILAQILVWGRDSLLTWNMLLQLGLLMGALVPAIMFGPRLKQFIINQITQRVPYGVLKRAARALATIATPIALFVTISVFIAGLGAMGQSTGVMEAGQPPVCLDTGAPCHPYHPVTLLVESCVLYDLASDGAGCFRRSG